MHSDRQQVTSSTAPQPEAVVRSGEFWAALSSLSYATTAIFSRVAVQTAHPFVAPIFRLFPVLTIAWTRVVRAGRLVAQLSPRSKDFIGWRLLFIVLLGGTLTTFIGTVGYFFALQAGGVVLTQPILATNILWGAVFAAIFLKEPLTKKMFVGIVAAVLGVAMLGYGSSSGDVSSSSLMAIPFAFIPAISWAASSNTTRYALTKGLDKYFVIAIGQTWAIVLLSVVLVLSGRGHFFGTVSWSAFGTLLLAGLLTASAQITLAQALSLTSVAKTTTINGMNPIISAILAYLLLGEQLNLLMVFGTLITIAGVIYVQVTATKDTQDEDIQLVEASEDPL